VITTRVNGAAELFRHGVDSLLLDDPADFKGLARQMDTLLDAPLRRRMGAAAREMALRHTLQRNVTEILGVYEEAIDLRRGTARMHGPHWNRVSGMKGPMWGGQPRGDDTAAAGCC
jgi:hypothetical protein